MASDVEALSYINLKDKEGFHVEQIGTKGKIEMHVFRECMLILRATNLTPNIHQRLPHRPSKFQRKICLAQASETKQQ